MFEGSLMNTKTKEGARNKGNPYFLRVPGNKGGLVNTGQVLYDNIKVMLRVKGHLNDVDSVQG